MKETHRLIGLLSAACLNFAFVTLHNSTVAAELLDTQNIMVPEKLVLEFCFSGETSVYSRYFLFSRYGDSKIRNDFKGVCCKIRESRITEKVGEKSTANYIIKKDDVEVVLEKEFVDGEVGVYWFLLTETESGWKIVDTFNVNAPDPD